MAIGWKRRSGKLHRFGGADADKIENFGEHGFGREAERKAREAQVAFVIENLACGVKLVKFRRDVARVLGEPVRREVLGDALHNAWELADPAREGLRICVELIEELSTIRGVAGVHIMAPSNDEAIPEAIKAARARVQRAAV